MTAETLPTVVIEREMSHGVDKVWRALTQGALIAEWLMANDFQPVVGHRFQFRSDSMPGWNGVTDCEVLEVVPRERLAYTFNASGAEAESGMKTVVTFTLAPSTKGTLLRVEQSGFRTTQVRNYQGAKYGWERNLGRLDEVAGRV